MIIYSSYVTGENKLFTDLKQGLEYFFSRNLNESNRLGASTSFERFRINKTHTIEAFRSARNHTEWSEWCAEIAVPLNQFISWFPLPIHLSVGENLCIFQKHLVKDADTYFIYSREHGAFWLPNDRGYVDDIQDAGIYTREQAIQRVKDANIYKESSKDFDEFLILVSEMFEVIEAFEKRSEVA